jgi:hypothetical protein
LSESGAVAGLVTVMLCGASLVACGPEIDPGSEVQTLRVLAVQKRTPYAKPGDEVEMRMLLHDGSDEAPRDIEVLWFAGCVNPVGDLFFECFRQFAEAGFDPTAPAPAGFRLGRNILSVRQPASSTFPPVFTAPIPVDIISSRPPPPDPRQPPYGLTYVFFAACAGDFPKIAEQSAFRSVPDAASGEVFPLGCFDPQTGEQLASRDFVAGYSAIYAYENIQNGNPNVEAFEFNGGALDTSHVCLNGIDENWDRACLEGPPDPPPCDPASVTCVAACPDDGDPKCPDIPLRAFVKPESADDDDVAGGDVKEQMWINYYVDRGGVASDVRLLNDATVGYNDDHGTNFFAPKEPGPVNIWAVVHDSRGGVTWAWAKVNVQ